MLPRGSRCFRRHRLIKRGEEKKERKVVVVTTTMTTATIDKARLRMFVFVVCFCLIGLNMVMCLPRIQCPAGPWMNDSTRHRREHLLRRYVIRQRLEYPHKVSRSSSTTKNCFYDSHRLYGYEHPDWPKPLLPKRVASFHGGKWHHGVWYPQIYIRGGLSPEETVRSLWIHSLWKAGATSIENAFCQTTSAFAPGLHGIQMKGTQIQPQNNNQQKRSILITRDPVVRFASAVSEIYYRGVYLHNKGNPVPQWWKYRHRLFNLTGLVHAMLQNAENPTACMGKAHPMHHIRSAGMFYSRARYPPGWNPSYDELWVVVGSTATTTTTATTRRHQANQMSLDTAFRKYKVNRHGAKPGRQSKLKPADVPRTQDIVNMLLLQQQQPDSSGLLQRVCRIYAADFICFDWPIPTGCTHLFL